MEHQIAPVYSVRQLAEACGGRLSGAGIRVDQAVRRVRTLRDADEESITWLAHDKFLPELANCRAAAVIGMAEHLNGFDRGIIVEDPELAVALVLEKFHVSCDRPPPGVHPTALVHASASIGPGAAVGALAVLGEGVRLGERAVIHEGVSLGRDVQVGDRTVIYDRTVVYDRCQIGNDVIIHAGAVIGADGFGYIFRDGRHRKLPHLGTVIIDDEVEIGANSTIDRGKVGPTRIGRGSKIDNLVQIAHNVQLGPLCVVAAGCGLAGSATIGQGVLMGGHAGVVEGVHVGDQVRIGAKSLVVGDVPAGSVLFGNPARDHKDAFRDMARVRKLPQLIERVAALEKKVALLEGAADHSKAR